MAWFRTDPQEVLKETVLWTNPSPTSTFTAQTVTLSDDINNYDYIRVKYKVYTTDTSTPVKNWSNSIVLVEDLKKMTSGGHTVYGSISNMNDEDSSRYTRAFRYASDTSIYFTASQGSANGNTNNSYAIPIQIIGIKRGIEVNSVLDLSLPPDAKYQSTLSNGATYTLAVTQKPKYVVLTLKDSASSSASSGYLFGIVNVETGVGYRYGYWSSAFRNDVWTNWNAYITSITDNSVTIANVYGTACYTTVGAYY